MGTLSAALAWAQRGFSVFPLRENTREPAFEGSWLELVSNDPETIRRLWTDPVLGTEHSYNVGCLCSDMVVVDIDVKNGKDGYNQYLQLGGTFDTLVVRTTTGGFHCYFYGPDSSNAGLADAVDVRSHNGYVVAPGSVIDGSAYEVVNDRDMAWIPSHMERLLKPVYIRTDIDGAMLDNPAAIEGAKLFLETAAPAIEGMRGDETTFIIAARLVREMALSVSTAFQLMRDHWNNRCIPPWEHDELLRKIENAANYGTADLGRLTPDILYGHLDIVPPPTVFDQGMTDWGNALEPHQIGPRPWLIDRMFLLGNVTLLLAAGSVGKSSISLAIAAHLAVGQDFAGYKVYKKAKTIIYNGEDDMAEQSRRLIAICMLYQLDYMVVKKSIMFIPARQLKISLVEKDQYGKLVRNDILVQQLVDKCSDPSVGLLILDPLVKIHRCEETSNVDMDYVMDTLTDIAYGANIAVKALHHTSKSGNAKQEERMGNMDIARGASAIVNASRVAFTLLSASQQDAEDYGLKEDERYMWVRMDDAKMNMSLATNKGTWFKRESVRIMSMDSVGVMRAESLERSRHHISQRIAEALIESMTANGSGSIGMPQAVAIVKSLEPLMANKTDADLRRRMEGLFFNPLVINGRTIQAVRDKEDGSKVLITLK